MTLAASCRPLTVQAHVHSQVLLLRARQVKLRKYLSLEPYCAALNFHQHGFSIPVSLIKRQRSLSEAVFISFGSTNGFPKML